MDRAPIAPREDPLVTVVLTVYRRTAFLHEAISSALSQSYRPIEIIVADDSNSPEIKAICDQYSTKELVYQPNTERLGVALSIAGALRRARGKYVAILNDDDVWEPLFLETLVKPLEEDKQRVLAFSDHWIINEKGDISAEASRENSIRYGRASLPRGDLRGDPVRFTVEQRGIPFCMASVFRRESFPADKLVTEVTGAYDYWCSCLLLSTGGLFYYCPERLTRYRVHGSMETRRKAAGKNENLVFIFERILQERWFPGRESLIIHRLADALFIAGKEALWFHEGKRARDYFSRSLRIHSRPKVFAAWALSFVPVPLLQALKLAEIRQEGET